MPLYWLNYMRPSTTTPTPPPTHTHTQLTHTGSYTERTILMQTQPKTLHTHISHLSRRYINISCALATLQASPLTTTLSQHTSPITWCYTEMITPLQTQPKTFHTLFFTPFKEVHKDGLCTCKITRYPPHPPHLTH